MHKKSHDYWLEIVENLKLDFKTTATIRTLTTSKQKKKEVS